MSDNWQTPEYILDAVRKTIGSDYFDPCPVNPTFNGIQIDWPNKNAFINPPYSRGSLEGWSKKAYKEYNKLSILKTQVIWLINYGCTENRQIIKGIASAICDLKTRISFINPATGYIKKGNDRDSVLYYWGCNQYVFKENFQHLGEVFTR